MYRKRAKRSTVTCPEQRNFIPENVPVRLTSAQLEELDYRKLYSAYSAKGRKSKVDPRVMFKVMFFYTLHWTKYARKQVKEPL